MTNTEWLKAMPTDIADFKEILSKSEDWEIRTAIEALKGANRVKTKIAALERELQKREKTREKKEKERNKRIYKLITDSHYVPNYGWGDDYGDKEKFMVVIGDDYFKDFIDELWEILGRSIYGQYEEGFTAIVQYRVICIDLCAILKNCNIDLEEIFPKEKFKY